MTLTVPERDRLRQRLMQYRGATEESVADELEMHEERAEVKKHLMAERGMSNTLAEVFLERQGYPRPPGWHLIKGTPYLIGSIRDDDFAVQLSKVSP